TPPTRNGNSFTPAPLRSRDLPGIVRWLPLRALLPGRRTRLLGLGVHDADLLAVADRVRWVGDDPLIITQPPRDFNLVSQVAGNLHFLESHAVVGPQNADLRRVAAVDQRVRGDSNRVRIGRDLEMHA